MLKPVTNRNVFRFQQLDLNLMILSGIGHKPNMKCRHRLRLWVFILVWYCSNCKVLCLYYPFWAIYPWNKVKGVDIFILNETAISNNNKNHPSKSSKMDEWSKQAKWMMSNIWYFYIHTSYGICVCFFSVLNFHRL